jgi:hypothetical protein
MKRFLLVVALTCALSSTAVAGNIPTGDIAPPPPPEAEGNIPTGDVASPVVVDLIVALIGIVT